MIFHKESFDRGGFQESKTDIKQTKVLLNCLISFFVVTHISLKILSGLQFSKEFFEILPHWGCFRPLKVQLGALELACH